MKFALLTVFILISIITVKSASKTHPIVVKFRCSTIFKHLADKYKLCFTPKYTKLQDKALIFLQNELSHRYKKRFIKEYCAETVQISNCVKNVSSLAVPQVCQDDYFGVQLKNIYTIVEIEIDYMCRNKGIAFREMTIDGGADCIATEKYEQCITTNLSQIGLNNKQKYFDHNMCLFLEIRLDCTSVINNCPNHKLKLHSIAKTVELRQRFNCKRYVF